jgi:hypothetical protein
MAKTKKQLEKVLLENTLLDRAVKKFRRTKLSKIQPERKDEDTREYILEKYGFKFRLYLNESLGDGHLWILNPKGYMFESFDLSNENYAPKIRKMYEEIRERVIIQKGKQKSREERDDDKNLRRFDRRL